MEHTAKRENLSLSSLWKLLSSSNKKGEKTFPISDKRIMLDGFILRKAFTFPMHLNFQRVTFVGDLDLRASHFLAGASFVDVSFEGAISFSHCSFEGHAYFWKCQFWKAVRFDAVRVTDNDVSYTERFAGETNFSYCTFNEQANFERMEVCGPTYFHRPVFRKHVKFDGATFRKRFILEGTANDICVSESELSPAALSLLLSRNLLVECRDHSGYFNFLLGVGSSKSLSQRIKGAQRFRALTEALGKSGRAAEILEEQMSTDPADWQPNRTERAGITKLWSDRFTSQTLPPGEECSFKGVMFAVESPFLHLHLDCCSFEGASVSNVDFVGVQWPRKRFHPWVSSRQITYDEFVLDESVYAAIHDDRTQQKDRLIRFISQPSRWSRTLEGWARNVYHLMRKRLTGSFQSEQIVRSKRPIVAVQARRDTGGSGEFVVSRHNVSDLYHRLRVRHEQKGDRESARDFYYGELETLRVCRPLFSRLFSLTNIYRLSSGYGKREGLALWWLVVLIFAFFPSLFLLNSAVLDVSFRTQTVRDRTSRAELSSLEASTFISRPIVNPQPSRPPTEWEVKLDQYRRLIEGCERIAVPLQAGLFLLAVKARFKGMG